MWKETKSSINHSENRKTLIQLLLENGNSSEISEWTKELNAESPGGCRWLRFSGECGSPDYGTCDGAQCDDYHIEKGKAYLWEEDLWDPGCEETEESYF